MKLIFIYSMLRYQKIVEAYIKVLIVNTFANPEGHQKVYGECKIQTTATSAPNMPGRKVDRSE